MNYEQGSMTAELLPDSLMDLLPPPPLYCPATAFSQLPVLLSHPLTAQPPPSLLSHCPPPPSAHCPAVSLLPQRSGLCPAMLQTPPSAH
eukprot:199908-Pelagomonas_calceolata.AAC.1